MSVENFADYGVPQSRRRFIVRAGRGMVPPLPDKVAPVGWYEAVSDLVDELPRASLLSKQKTAVKKVKVDEPVWSARVGYGVGRLSPGSKPAPTLTRAIFTDHKGSCRYHFADLVLPNGKVKQASIECAKRIQTFPEWYKLPDSVAVAGSILGYSVPPLFITKLFRKLASCTYF